MPFCHFSKINRGTTLSSIKEKMVDQKTNDCKKLEYSVIATITISPDEFELICNDISKPHICYKNLTNQSTSSPEGKWRCIIIRNSKNHDSLILYTAGRLFPLYASFYEG